MEKTYTQHDLQYILGLYNNPYNDQNQRNYAIAMADQLFREIARGTADIEESAYDDFQTVLNTFSPLNMSGNNTERINEDSRLQAQYWLTRRQNSNTTNQDNQTIRVYSTADLQYILGLYNNPYNDQNQRNYAIAMADQLFREIARGVADIEESAYDDFQTVLNTFSPLNISGNNTERINEDSRLQAQYWLTRRQNSNTTNQDTQNLRVYSRTELQHMLDMYRNADTRNEAIAEATRFLNNLLNKKADFERTAFGTVQQILGTFGRYFDQPEEQTHEEEREIPIYTNEYLQGILREYENAATRDAARARAARFLTDFANGDADIDDDALESVQQILRTFGRYFRQPEEEHIVSPSQQNINTPVEQQPVNETGGTPINETAPDTPTQPGENQDVPVYTNEQLQYMLTTYENAATHDAARTWAERFLQDFANGNADVEDDALESLNRIIDTFGVERDENGYPRRGRNGNLIHNATGNRALERIENNRTQRNVNRDPRVQQGELTPSGTHEEIEPIEEEIEPIEGVVVEEDNPNQQQHVTPATTEAPEADNGNEIHTTEQDRFNSMTSDENQIRFNLITLGIYRDMRLVDASINPATMTPQQVADAINAIRLDDRQRIEYSNRFYDMVVNDPDLFENTPPRILADAYTFTRNQLLQRPNDPVLSRRFETLARRIDHLIMNFSQQINYFYADPSNIADVYAGYRRMFDARRPDLRNGPNEATRQYNQNINNAIDYATNQLEDVVRTYSEMWNLQNLTPENAEQLDARWGEISNGLNGITLDDNMLARLARYQFLDENDQPIPQFLDANNNPQVDFQPGYRLDPNGRLNRIISLAKTDVTMRNVGDLDTNVPDIDLTRALSDRIQWKIAEISTVDQAIQNIRQNPRQNLIRMLNEQEVQDIWNEIDTNGGHISDIGYQAALDAQVNQAAGWAGMMAERVGFDQPIVMRPFEAVRDIDRLASTRTEQVGAEERNQRINTFARIAKNFGAAAITSAGIGIIGHATGAAVAGAIIGTALGIGNMAYQGFKWRRAQIALNQPHGIRDFLADRRNWGPAIASGFGVAAVISMAAGAPEFSAAFGIGAISIGGGSAAKATYDDALASGQSRAQALASAIGVMAASIIGGLVFAPIDGGFPYGIGTMGIYEQRPAPRNRGPLTRMRERIGALADRIGELISQEENHNDNDVNIPPHPNNEGQPHTDDTPADGGNVQQDQPHAAPQGEEMTLNDDDPRPQDRGFFGRIMDNAERIVRDARNDIGRMRAEYQQRRHNANNVPPQTPDDADQQQEITPDGSAPEAQTPTRRFLDNCRGVAEEISQGIQNGVQEVRDGITRIRERQSNEDGALRHEGPFRRIRSALDRALHGQEK